MKYHHISTDMKELLSLIEQEDEREARLISNMLLCGDIDERQALTIIVELLAPEEGDNVPS